jgi:hypothetical protein
MARIVAARFETGQEADRATQALVQAGIRQDKLASFEVLPPGQHGLYPIGGDAAHDRGTRKSFGSAATGAAVGIVVGAFIGWAISEALVGRHEASLVLLGTLAGAGVGAYVGSFIGAMILMRNPRASRASVDEPVSRKSGPLVAVEVDERAEQFAAACDVFVALDALEIEEADGRIRDGDWVDFDPRLPPHTIIATEQSAAANTITRVRRAPMNS